MSGGATTMDSCLLHSIQEDSSSRCDARLIRELALDSKHDEIMTPAGR